MGRRGPSSGRPGTSPSILVRWPTSSRPSPNGSSIFDGAFGTWVQGRDLGPDDFGGAALEGCNENLVLTRPDEIAEMHSQFFAVGVDAVETATFGAFSLVLNEYDIADKAYEINLQAAADRQGGRDRASRPPTGPGS